jgi:hypothetical protein
VGARISTTVQSGRGAHPASCTVGAGSVPGVKWLGRGIDNLPALVWRFKKEKRYASTPLLGLHGLLQGEL